MHQSRHLTYTLRDFERADLDGIMEIEEAAFGEEAWPRRDFLDVAKSREAQFQVAVSGSQIAGYCIGAELAGEGYIASIAVHQAHHRQGVGHMLLEAMIAVLQDRGAGPIALHVNVSNEAALGLYRALGFAPTETISQYYLDGSPAYFMIRPAAG